MIVHCIFCVKGIVLLRDNDKFCEDNVLLIIIFIILILSISKLLLISKFFFLDTH